MRSRDSFGLTRLLSKELSPAETPLEGSFSLLVSSSLPCELRCLQLRQHLLFLLFNCPLLSKKRFCSVCLKPFLLGRPGLSFSKRAVIAEQLLSFVSKHSVTSFWTWLPYFPRQSITASFSHAKLWGQNDIVYRHLICWTSGWFPFPAPPDKSREIWKAPS